MKLNLERACVLALVVFVAVLIAHGQGDNTDGGGGGTNPSVNPTGSSTGAVSDARYVIKAGFNSGIQNIDGRLNYSATNGTAFSATNLAAAVISTPILFDDSHATYKLYNKVDFWWYAEASSSFAQRWGGGGPGFNGVNGDMSLVSCNLHIPSGFSFIFDATGGTPISWSGATNYTATLAGILTLAEFSTNVTLSGAVTNATYMVNYAPSQVGLICHAICTNANVVMIKFDNSTAITITPSATTFWVRGIQNN